MRRAVETRFLHYSQTEWVKIGSCEMQGYRPENEDEKVVETRFWSLKYPEPLTVVAVFDGHNGPAASKFCSKYFLSEMEKLEDPMDKHQLQSLFLTLDRKFLSMQEYKSHGTCGIVVVIRPPNKRCPMFEISTAHVGDSRAIQIKTNSKVPGGVRVIPLSADHKPNDEQERKRIKKAGGFVLWSRVDGELAISRAIGDAPYKDESLPHNKQKVIAVPTFTRSVASPGTKLAVMCDGLLETMTADQIGCKVVRLSQKYQHPTTVASKMVKLSLKKGSRDNHTFILIELTDNQTDTPDLHLADFIPGKFEPYPYDDKFVNAFLVDAKNRGYSLTKVFEKMGDLKVCRAINRFVKTKKRLPTVEEVEKSGLAVAPIELGQSRALKNLGSETESNDIKMARLVDMLELKSDGTNEAFERAFAKREEDADTEVDTEAEDEPKDESEPETELVVKESDSSVVRKRKGDEYAECADPRPAKRARVSEE